MDEGYEVTYLKPERAGRVSVDELRAALREDTVLVSLLLVNNELDVYKRQIPRR